MQPMILAVNIGNTNIRAAIGRHEIIDQIVFYATDGPIIEQIEAGLGSVWDQIEGSIIASVVPSQTEMVKAALEQKTGRPVKQVNKNLCGDLRVDKYEGLLGEDRVVCCAQALNKMRKSSPEGLHKPFVVIDYGTATTINVVNGDGEFLGGAILTGLQTGLDALTRNTAQLPHIEIEKAEIPLIGTNTIENLQSGAAIGLACATEGFLKRIEEEMGCQLSVIVTGGHGPVVLPYCRFDYIHEPSLLLEGLLELYRTNPISSEIPKSYRG